MNDVIGAIEANWLIYGGVVLLALLIAWWLLPRSGKRTRAREHQPDVLDAGVAPAARNQALIDAAPAAQIVMPPVMSDALGGMGEIVAMAAQAEVEEARVAGTTPPPPSPAEPAPERRPAPEVIAEPVPMPGLDETASPDQTEQEVQTPDAVIEPELAPAPEPAAVALTPASDDLSRIKGLGPKLQTLLPTLGLSTYAQIAALSEADLVKLDAQLGPFAGRPARDGWVEQAQYLAAGDVARFEARFGKV